MGQILIDRYVIETLMRDLIQHDKKPSAFVVYLYLWHRTLGESRASIHQSHQQLADATGLSKSAVQSAIRTLVRRRLVRAHRASPTATPEYFLYRPWAEDEG
jgi:DNA-binding MarR family transcriptional regulator